jgi:hypothetical protein
MSESLEPPASILVPATPGEASATSWPDTARPPSADSLAAAVVSSTRVCRACGATLPHQQIGRSRRFCSAACREAARLRRMQGLPEWAPRVKPGGRRRLRARLVALGVVDPDDLIDALPDDVDDEAVESALLTAVSRAAPERND